jgi:MazG family protein
VADSAAAELARLEELVRTLRARCPWDRRQTHVSLAPHLMEEAYEALEAIEDLGSAEPAVPSEVVAHLEEELGDVLFQVFFHSVLAEEKGRFTLTDVARAVHDKLVRRHPHVFGDVPAETAEDVAARWEVLKRSEKPGRGATGGIPDAMPALAAAAKLLRKAESLDMDLPSAAERHATVVASLEHLEHIGDQRSSEEAEDLDVPRGPPSKEVEVSSSQEVKAVGELLLAVVDLARRIGVDPETALRAETRRLRRALDTGERLGSQERP